MIRVPAIVVGIFRDRWCIKRNDVFSHVRSIMSVKYWIDRGIMDADFVDAKVRLYIRVFILYNNNGTVQFFMLYPFSRFDSNSNNYQEFFFPRIFLMHEEILFFFVINILVKYLTIRLETISSLNL